MAVAVEQAPHRRWFRRSEDRALTRATIPAIFLPRSSTGEPVTTRNAMTLLDVWACVRTLAAPASTVPLHAYWRTPQGRERVDAQYLDEPAPGMPQGTFVAWAITSLALHGEAFLGLYRGSDGEVQMVSLLDPSLVGVEVGPDGEPVYTYVNCDGEPLVLFRRDVAHARLLTIDGVRGLSPIAQCRDALGLAGALSKHASESATGGYRPDGVVTVREGPGAEDVAENLRKNWSERHSKPGKTAFVTSEVSYVPISIPAKDAEFVEQRRLSTIEVCRVFRGAAVDGGGRARRLHDLQQHRVAGRRVHQVRPRAVHPRAGAGHQPRRRVAAAGRHLLRVQVRRPAQAGQRHAGAGLHRRAEPRDRVDASGGSPHAGEPRQGEQPMNRPTAGEVEQRNAPDAPVTVEAIRLRGLVPDGVESRDLGGWREVIDPGALAGARLDDLVCTVDHAGLLLGRFPTTLAVEHADDGMHWSVELPESRSDVREAVERGDLKAGSWRATGESGALEPGRVGRPQTDRPVGACHGHVPAPAPAVHGARWRRRRYCPLAQKQE